MISLIWAMDKNWLIGDGEKLPWRYPEDLKYFREKIAGHKILVGAKTYKSILRYTGGKGFPRAQVFVASLNKNTDFAGAETISDVKDFLQNHKQTDEEIWRQRNLQASVTVCRQTLYHFYR